MTRILLSVLIVTLPLNVGAEDGCCIVVSGNISGKICPCPEEQPKDDKAELKFNQIPSKSKKKLISEDEELNDFCDSCPDGWTCDESKKLCGKLIDESKTQEWREKCEKYLQKSEVEMDGDIYTRHIESSKAYSQLAIAYCTRALLEEIKK